VTVDDAQVPEELRPSVVALSDLAAASARTRPGPVLRSQPHYAITLSGDHGPRLLTLYESQVPASVQPLLDLLMRYAR
jgi:hypothetical protein